MQPDFAESLLSAAKAEGLHTAIESCCFASRDVISRVFAHVDLGLPDIKHMDSKRHKKFTGVPNEPILDNLRYIYHELKTPFMVSLPVIPGYNDSRENITATASFIAAELGKDVPLRLLPYHRLGEGKAESLGKRANLEIGLPSDEHMQQLKTLAESFGLQVQIGG